MRRQRGQRERARKRTRIGSFLLAVLMVLTMLPQGMIVANAEDADKTAGAVVTEQDGINVLQNPGLELTNDDKTAFIGWHGERYQVVADDTSKTHSGAMCGMMPAALSQQAYLYSTAEVPYNYNAAVTAGMWVRLEDASDAEKVLLVLERPNAGDSNVLVRPEATTDWQFVELSGEAMSGCERHTLKIEVQPGNTGVVYFDDAVILPSDEALPATNYLRNGGFENGNKGDWGYKNDNAGSEQEKETFVALETTETHSGDYAVKVPAGIDDEAYAYNVAGIPHDKSQGVSASIWVNLTNASDAGKVKFIVERPGIHNIDLTPEAKTGWQKLTIDDDEVGLCTGQVVKFAVTSGTEGDIYFDDAWLGAYGENDGTSESEGPDEDWSDLASTEDKTAGAVVTGESGINLANNPGFERENATEAWGPEGLTVETNTTFTHSGAKSVKVPAEVASSVEIFSGITADIDRTAGVTAGMWVFLKDAADAEKVEFVLERKSTSPGGDTLVQSLTGGIQGWNKLTLTGAAITDAGIEEFVIKAVIQADRAGDIYLDDAFVMTDAPASINWLRNGGFEKDKGSWGANDDVEFNDAVIADEGRSGYALPMDLAGSSAIPNAVFQANGWWGASNPTYDGKTDMTYSIWAKSVDGSAGSFKLVVERKDGFPNVEQTFSVAEDSEWTQYVMQVPMLESGTLVEALFHIKLADGSGTVYFDDARLTLKWEPDEPDEPEGPDEPETPPNWEDYQTELSQTPGVVDLDLADAAGINLLPNPGFEWVTIAAQRNILDARATEAWGPDGLMSITDPLYTHSGDTSVKIAAGTAQTAVFNVVTADYDKTAAVEAGMWVYLKNVSDATKVQLALERKYEPAGGVTVDYPNATGTLAAPQRGWNLLTLSADALGEGESCNVHVLTVKIESGTVGDIYLDDGFVFTAAPASINWIRNGGFEDGNSGWGYLTNTEIRAGAGIDDGNAVVMTAATPVDYCQANTWWGPSYPLYDGGTAMTYSVWAKSNGGSGTFRLRAERKNSSGMLIDQPQRSFAIAGNSDWTEYFVHIPATASEVYEVIFHLERVSLAGEVLFDDAAVNLRRDIEHPQEPSTGGGGGGASNSTTSTANTGSVEEKLPGAVVTGMTGVNAVENPGFEAGLTGWSLTGGVMLLTNSPSAAHSGTGALQVSRAASMRYNVSPFQDSAAAASFSGWVCLSRPEDAEKVSISLARKSGGSVIVKPEAKLGWQQVTGMLPAKSIVALPSGAAALSLLSGGMWRSAASLAAGAKDAMTLTITVQGGTKLLYLDDFFVEHTIPKGTEFVTNGSFEQLDDGSKSVSHWGLMPGWDTVANAIQTSGARSGKHMVRIAQSDVERALLQSTNWINKVTTPVYNPSTPMLLTAWVKYENLDGGGAWLKAERKYDDGQQALNTLGTPLIGSSNGWTQLELYLPPAPAMSFDEVLVGVTVSPGGGTIWVDSISFTPTELRAESPDTAEPSEQAVIPDDLPPQTGVNWLTNPSFEQDLQDWGLIGPGELATGVAIDGGKALKAGADAHFWNVVVTQLDKSREFVLTLGVKLDNPDDADQVRIFIDRKQSDDSLISRYETKPAPIEGWQEVMLYVGAEAAECTYFVLGLDTMETVAPVYFDDFYLTYARDNPAEGTVTLEVVPPVEDPSVLYDQYLANGSFELGEAPAAERWGAIPDWGTRISLTDVAYEGARAVRFDLSTKERTNLFQSDAWGGALPYDSGKPVLLQGYLKLEGVNGDGVRLKIERKYDDRLIDEPYLTPYLSGTSDWQLVELYLPPIDHAVGELVIGIEAGEGKGTVYIDNLSLRETAWRNVKPNPLAGETAPASANSVKTYSTLLKNPGVEELNADGTVTHWDVWPGNPAEGTRKSYTSTSIKHSGERSVAIELVFSNGQAIYQYRLPDDNPFPFNEDYIFSAWIKMDGVAVYDGEGVTIGVKRMGADGQEYNLYQPVKMGTYDWTLVELEVPKVEDIEIVQYDVIVDIGSGSGTIYFDDFELSPAELNQEVAPLAFETVDVAPTNPTLGAQNAPAEESLPEPRAAFPWEYVAAGAILLVAIGSSLISKRKKRAAK